MSINKRKHERIKYDDINNDVEITFEGMTSVTGVIDNFSRDSLYIAVKYPDNLTQKCFLRIYTDGNDLYSRGHVVRKDGNGLVIRLENSLKILDILLRRTIMSRGGSLQKIITARKFIELRNTATKEYENIKKINCWEATKCGKENYCTAGTNKEYDGFFGGKNGGRFCAFAENTSCKGGRALDLQEKVAACSKCGFYQEILKDVFPNQF